jgi:hypothetical protein
MNIAYLIGLLDTREKFNNMGYAGQVVTRIDVAFSNWMGDKNEYG